MAINGILNFKDSNGNVTAVYPVTSVENVSGLSSALADKVDEEPGKGLSTEDFTTELLAKLNDIEALANKTVIDSALSSSSTNPVQNKKVKEALDLKVDKVTGKGLSTEDYTTSERSKLSNIEAEANKTVVDTELSNTSTNPVQNKKVYAALSDKVDKVSGKGLSSNDYTNNEKNKLAGIATGAEVNVQADWNQTTVTADDYIKNKPTLGTAAAANASDFATAAQGTKADNAIPSSAKGTAHGVAELDGNGLVPSSQLPSFVDDVLEYVNYSGFPVPGETGKIYVATDTNLTYRWSGSTYVEISPSLALGTTSSTAFRGDRGQTAYNHATDSSRLTTAKTSGLYKIATTAEGHVASAIPVTKKDITDLGIPANIVTPEMYGAVGDGVADDTTAVQQAISHGGMVMLDNTYRVTSTINITESYTTICGQGTLYGDLSENGVILKGHSDNTNPVQLDHVTIRDISITQNQSNSNKHTGISFDHEITPEVANYGFVDVLIDGVNIYKLTHRGIQLHGGSYTQNTVRPYVTIQNCRIESCGGIGICQSRVSSKIIACHIYLSGYENITIDNGCWMCLVSDCTLRLARGGCANIGIDQCDRCVIVGNHFVEFDYNPQTSDDYDNAIRLNCRTGDVKNLIFAGNTIVGGKYGVWLGNSETEYFGSGVFNNNIFLSVGVSDFYFDKVSSSVNYKVVIKGNQHSKVVNSEFVKGLEALDSDVPVELDLSDYVNEGFSLASGSSITNKAIVTGDKLYLTARFYHDNKQAGDIPFSLPVKSNHGADCYFQDGHEVCLRTNGNIQLYGDYINMDDEDQVEFSVCIPRA